jgi:hypothetical protein
VTTKFTMLYPLHIHGVAVGAKQSLTWRLLYIVWCGYSRCKTYGLDKGKDQFTTIYTHHCDTVRNSTENDYVSVARDTSVCCEWTTEQNYYSAVYWNHSSGFTVLKQSC